MSSPLQGGTVTPMYRRKIVFWVLLLLVFAYIFVSILAPALAMKLPVMVCGMIVSLVLLGISTANLVQLRRERRRSDKLRAAFTEVTRSYLSLTSNLRVEKRAMTYIAELPPPVKQELATQLSEALTAREAASSFLGPVRERVTPEVFDDPQRLERELPELIAVCATAQAAADEAIRRLKALDARCNELRSWVTGMRQARRDFGEPPRSQDV